MNKKNWIIAFIIFLILLGTGYFFFTRNTSNVENNKNTYETSKTATNSSTSNTDNNIASENENTNTENITEVKENATQNTEETLATFTTTIYSNDSARQNNIRITCNTLNETVVNNGDTFSFCSTVGQASSSKGYQEADIFDKNGNKKKGLGGGNCQISSTLYNAILAVPSLSVTERHPHSNKVPYIATGKDAAVAYGSYDLKFVNNSGRNIKILASTNGNYITTTIMGL